MLLHTPIWNIGLQSGEVHTNLKLVVAVEQLRYIESKKRIQEVQCLTAG